jgi:hypothetical protein
LRAQTRTKLLKPELIFSELLKDSFQENFKRIDSNSSIFKRAIVLAVDVVGGQLQNENGEGEILHTVNGKQVKFKALKGPSNPRNSIKARIISESEDKILPDSLTDIFWPVFPEHISIPIKPLEHAYVMYEDDNSYHGLWFCKISGHENLNFIKGSDTYKSSDKNITKLFTDVEDTTYSAFDYEYVDQTDKQKFNPKEIFGIKL